ncbi:MAG: 3-deoxy-7-phosphoheptulonate synthase, partial [Bacteroidales bacterium]
MQPIIIAGPCSAESEEQLYCTAQQLYDHLLLSSHKLSYFRTGIWKPRSRPKEFQGAGKAALPWLNKINRDFGFPICVEVASPEHLHDCLEAGIKTVWIGSRTAVNPFVVQELADTVKGEEITVLVKNPIVPDLKLWIGNIERFLNASVKEVIAIHRGFSEKNERVYRYHPMWDIPIELKVHYPDIPIICDPSHISGNKKHIAQISQIALDYGFNGLMIETHYRPKEALSDARQQITPIELTHLLAHLSFKSTLTSP